MDSEYASNDDVRVADEVRARGSSAMMLIGHTYDAVDTTLKRHGRRSHTRRAD